MKWLGGVATQPFHVNIWGIATARSPVSLDLLPILIINQVAHRLHMAGITRERQAAQAPATLDRSKQRVMVKGQIGGPC